MIVRDMTDKKMLQFMGRESGEDYGTDFLTMLNTWEGGIKFSNQNSGPFREIDIARLLGWTEADTSGKPVTSQYSQFIPHGAVSVGGPFC